MYVCILVNYTIILSKIHVYVIAHCNVCIGYTLDSPLFTNLKVIYSLTQHYEMQLLDLVYRAGSILEWTPHWIYYEINTYFFHNRFFLLIIIKIYHVFLSVANTIAIVNTHI